MTIIERDLHLDAYVFVEFPKWVTLADGSQELVANADEEAALTAPVKADPKAVVEEKPTEDHSALL